MPQDPEYLAVHKLLLEKDAQIEQLKAELKDMTQKRDELAARLTILSNTATKTWTNTDNPANASAVVVSGKPVGETTDMADEAYEIPENPSMIMTFGKEATDLAEEFGQAIVDSTSEETPATVEKPTKKRKS